MNRLPYNDGFDDAKYLRGCKKSQYKSGERRGYMVGYAEGQQWRKLFKNDEDVIKKASRKTKKRRS